MTASSWPNDVMKYTHFHLQHIFLDHELLNAVRRKSLSLQKPTLPTISFTRFI